MKTYAYLWQYLAQFLLEWTMIQAKVIEKWKHVLNVQYIFFFLEIREIYGIMWKVIYGRAGRTWQMPHAHCPAGYLGLLIHTQNKYYLLLFHCNNGYAK